MLFEYGKPASLKIIRWEINPFYAIGIGMALNRILNVLLRGAQFAPEGFTQPHDIPSHGLDPLELTVLMPGIGKFGHGNRIGIRKGPCVAAFIH